MKTGLKSLLFGVHQIIYHPLTVLFAWIELYHKFPNYKELICIFIHDLGYYNCEKMDDENGQNHPQFAGNLIYKYMFKDANKDLYYMRLCLGHSRHYAKKLNIPISKLYKADKLSMKYDFTPFYFIRAKLSGELNEYIYEHPFNPYGSIENISEYQWCKNARLNGIKLSKNENAIPYLKLKR